MNFLPGLVALLLVACTLVARAATPDAAAPAGLPVLTSAAAVRQLGSEEASAPRRVHLRGVVTLLPENTGNQGSFTLDDGEGVWVTRPPADFPGVFPAQLRLGDVVELRGRTSLGRFSPVVIWEQVEVVGRAAQPAAKIAAVHDFNSGVLDCQRIVVTGVVQAATLTPGMRQRELQIRLNSPLGIVVFFLQSETLPPLNELVDSKVELTGVCLSFFNSRRQFLGARLYSNDPADVRVLDRRTQDPFTAPHRSIGRLMTFSPGGQDPHRVQVRGVVTLSNPGHYFYLEENGAALRVNTRQRTPMKVGDIVEAAGFLELRHHRAEMIEAVFRGVGTQEPPVAIEILRHQAFVQEPQTVYSATQDLNDRLVALRGTLLSLDDEPGTPFRMNLMCDGLLVSAEIIRAEDRARMQKLVPGSELRVSGICQMTYSASPPVTEWPQPVEMELLVRDGDDVQVVRAASFWTPQRLFGVLALLAIILLVAALWVFILRRQVAQRGQRLAEEIRARRDAAVEFESALRERNRLAADLHDTMEQSLTGLAFQMEASQALRTTTPERSFHHLSLAQNLLARSREDLRRSIWNLRANPLERQTLVQALREVAASRSLDRPVRIDVESAGPERELPDFVAGNMLLLAQEAVTNAFKHAEPSRLVIRLEFLPGKVALSVQDNGKGFEPAQAAGPTSGHFGLQGMKERTKRLGGTLTVTSRPGEGTTILATIAVD